MVGMVRGVSSIAAAMLLLCGAACSRRGDSPELVALENAYKSGVLTKDEYTVRAGAIRARAAQFAALDRAMQAGLLSKDEYAAKKSALLTSGPPAPGPPTSGVPASAPPPPGVPAPAAPPVTAAVSPPATDSQSHSYRMKLARIVDAQGFERPIPSASLLIPVDWQSQGATTWNLKDKCNGVQTHLLVSSPDGHAFERFPVYSWVWADDPRPLQAAFAQRAQMGVHACDVMAPMGAQEYLQRNLAKLRPGAQLVGFEPAPKLMESLRQQAQQTEEAARRFNVKKQVKYDAIRARVRYNVDGKPMEEWILAGTAATGTFGPMQHWTYNCIAYSAGQRAPLGSLDSSAKLFELIASTFRIDPDWQARIAKNALAMQQIELKGVRDRAAIVAKSADDTRKTRQQMYENQQRAEDQNSTQFSQYLRGVETYQNPATGVKVDLDSNYGHAWVNDRGEYLLSDQAGFDPNSVPGNTLNWTQLQQVKK
jgi:hypothetical protein